LLARITRHMRDHFQVSNSSLSVLPLLNNYYLEQFTNSQPRYLPSIDGQVAKIQQRCTLIALGLIAAVVAYVALQLLIHATQHKGEPRLLESKLPFFDSAIGILQHRANYLSKLR
jgi:hypothetical protein